MRSSDETIQRFLKADGAIRRAELLDDEGRVTDDIRRAAEVRFSRAAGAGLLCIRIELTDTAALGLQEWVG